MADYHGGSSPRVDLTKRQGGTPPVVPPSSPLTPPPPQPPPSTPPAHQAAIPASPSSDRGRGRQAASGSGGGKKAGRVAAAVAVGVLVAAVGVFVLGEGFSTDEREPEGATSTQYEQPAADDSAVTDPTPSTASTVDVSGNPIVDGWFVLVSSALKGSAEVDSLPEVAASNGGQVVDTDS